MSQKQTLELTWIGKEHRPKLEPRILLEDQDKSYHAAHRVTDNDGFDNRLIFGDNLLALKALEAEFTGKIKCVFIDSPYNKLLIVDLIEAFIIIQPSFQMLNRFLIYWI